MTEHDLTAGHLNRCTNTSPNIWNRALWTVKGSFCRRATMTRAPPATPYVVMTPSMIVDPHPPPPLATNLARGRGGGGVGADNQDRRHTSHEDLYGSGTASPMLPQAIAPSAQLAGPPPATHFRCDARPAVPSATTHATNLAWLMCSGTLTGSQHPLQWGRPSGWLSARTSPIWNNNIVPNWVPRRRAGFLSLNVNFQMSKAI